MRTITLVALLLWAMPLFADEPKSVSVKTINSTQRAIVPIACAEVTGDRWVVKRIIGTGFFVNRDGYFLTAAHVVTDWERISTNFGPCVPAIYIPEMPWGERDRTPEIRVRWFAFIECKTNVDLDVAACKPIQNPFINQIVGKNINSLKLGSIDNHPDGSPVAFTGFPLDFHVPVTSKGYIAAYTAGDKKLVIDKSAWPGASGSPIYDGEGKVIGVVQQTGSAERAGLTYAIPIDAILEFLTKEKIAVEK
jgi:S1-C subfamily serine protease